jgi:hypothetical protein
MILPSQPIRRCNQFLLAALSVSIPSLNSLHAMQVEALTHHGMRLDGRVHNSCTSVMELQQSDSDGRAILPIPVQSIRSLKWHAATIDPANALQDAAAHPHLWPLLDPPSTGRLASLIEDLTAAGEWESCYHFASQLLPSVTDPALRLRLTTLQLWCLYELKLYQRAQQQLNGMRPQLDPDLSPLRLHWLAARLYLKADDFTEAMRWAALPFLRIPSANGPLADELLEIHQQAMEASL